MRDPNRIDEVLTQLREVWERNPDLRLGQIVVSAASLSRQPIQDVPAPRDPFYIEDGDLLCGLRHPSFTRSLRSDSTSTAARDNRTDRIAKDS